MQADPRPTLLRDPQRLAAAGACGLFWIIQMLNTDPTNFNSYLLLAAYGALGLGILTISTRMSAWVVLGYVAVTGVLLRLVQPLIVNSDVWRNIVEATATLFSGNNPYSHYYLSSTPPGSPLPYLPGALLYGIVQNGWWNGLAQLDRPAAIAIVLCFVALARIYGPGLASLGAVIYASSELAIWRSLDGSNDTAVAMLIAFGVVALAFARDGGIAKSQVRNVLYVVSAVFFGWAIGFKALAWPIYPFVAIAVPPAYRRMWFATSLGVLAVLCLPFFVWNPAAFVHQIWLGFTLHTNVWGLDIWNPIDHIRPGTVESLGGFPLGFAFFAFGATAMLLWRRNVDSLGEAMLRGAALVAVMLALPRWSTTSYYIYATAILGLGVACFGPGRLDRQPADDGGQ